MTEEDKEAFRIGILEPSTVITEGLSNILLKAGGFDLYHIDYVTDIEHYIVEDDLQFIIINPQVLLVDTKEFLYLKQRTPNVIWCALVYSFFERQVLEMFDMQLQITVTKIVINYIILYLIMMVVIQSGIAKYTE